MRHRPVVRFVHQFYGGLVARQPRIHEVSPGVWTFRLSEGTDVLTGKRRQRRHRVTGSREDAERQLRDLQLRKAYRSSPTSSITLTAVRDLWDESTLAQGRRRASTAAIETSAYQRHLAPLLGHLPLYRIDPAAITRAYDELLCSVSPALLRRLHQQLSSVLTWAYRRGYLEQVPTQRVELPRVMRREPTAPTTEEVRELLESVDDPVLWLTCRLAATLGLRRGELAGLQLGDVNFDDGTVRVERSVFALTGESPQAVPTKTGDRGVGTLAIDSGLLDVIRVRRLDLVEAALQIGVTPDGLYLLSYGDPTVPTRPDRLTRLLSRHVEGRPDLAKVTLHSLRRYVASTLVESGVDIATAGLVLRHADHSTTARHYVARRVDRARDVTRSIGAELDRYETNSA